MLCILPKPRNLTAALSGLAMLAASGLAQVNVKIHFETAGATTPFGYIKDFGDKYSSTTKRGWIKESSLSGAHAALDLRGNGRSRARAGVDPLQNTCLYMQYPATGTETGTIKTNGAYEYTVPNGMYKVVVSVGDQPPYNSVNTIRVEGATVIAGFAGSAANEFKVDSVTVNVTDGKVTVDALGGTDTRINYLRISTLGAPPEPAPVDLRINFQDPLTVPPAGYLKDYGQAYGLRTGANQGTGLNYGWVVPGSTTPRDLSLGGSGPGNGRNRGTPADARIATLMHMQPDNLAGVFNGTKLPGSWEIAVPDNWYTVTVSVGDALNLDSKHKLTIEGQPAIDLFTPTAINPFFAASKVVQVTDGRLTLDAAGGTNTKINYVLIKNDIPAAGRPSVSRGSPSMAQTGVFLDAAFTAEVNLPNGAVNGNTVKDATVQLFNSKDNAKIAAQVNTSGGGDVVVLQPTAPLEPNKGYRFELSSGVQDALGQPFIPYSGYFTSGTAYAFQPTTQQFDRISLAPAAGAPANGSSGYMFTSITMGPDGFLYAGTLTGQILKYELKADGTINSFNVITSLQTFNANGNRAIIGMAWDPTASPSQPVLWVTNNAPTVDDSPDWSGRLTRMSGPDLADVKDFVINFPRATKDHMTNSAAFGPGGALYVTHGSRSANGGYDGTWKGDEHLLNAAILRIDVRALSETAPLDVKTEDVPTPYNPFAPGAAVTIYASGIRNAYDLVWHSNGSLYTAGNGSAAGGTTPTTPATLPAICADRLDKAAFGPYTGPFITGFSGNKLAQPDFLYRILPGKYYGHPNPKRCEWVLNGGNPTSGLDYLEELQYAVGVEPDRNWQRPEYVLGMHFSPNGTIEYKSNAFAGALKTKLLITRYSVGKDILVLTIDNSTKQVTATNILNIGGAKFADPLDLTENTTNGNIYVTEYAGKKITLLRPH